MLDWKVWNIRDAVVDFVCGVQLYNYNAVDSMMHGHTAAAESYHIHDLDQTEGEHNGERLGVVGHWPLHPIVVL